MRLETGHTKNTKLLESLFKITSCIVLHNTENNGTFVNLFPHVLLPIFIL